MDRSLCIYLLINWGQFALFHLLAIMIMLPWTCVQIFVWLNCYNFTILRLCFTLYTKLFFQHDVWFCPVSVRLSSFFLTSPPFMQTCPPSSSTQLIINPATHLEAKALPCPNCPCQPVEHLGSGSSRSSSGITSFKKAFQVSFFAWPCYSNSYTLINRPIIFY